MSESTALAHFTSDDDILALWHHQLGHLNIKSVKHMNGMVSDMDIQNRPKLRRRVRHFFVYYL